ncbi:MAG: hypothetical protein ACTHJ0_02350 [Flavipsychrobacter sp.]
MAKRLINPVKARLNHERIEALHTICDDMLKQFVPEDEHEHLLHEYLSELHHRLRKMKDRNQELYTLSMSGTEAIAFRQLWGMLDLRQDKYASIIVSSIIGQIDRYNKTNTRIAS